MPGRYDNWLRTRTDPDTPPENRQQALARKVMGELMDRIRLGGLFQDKIRRVFADGTVVIAQFDGTTPIVQVINPAAAAAEEEAVLTSLWIPRGFVFVPGNAEAPKGWGLPVRQQPGDDEWPFGAENLAPGLEVTRWTAGGPAAQVLLTRDDTESYPDTERQRLPIGYADSEWMAGTTWEPEQVGWHVVRPTFEGFEWTPDERGARMALWRAVTTRLDRDLMALPFAGYYDDAQHDAVQASTYGMDDSHWIAGYDTVAERANKDGVRGSYNEAWYANGTPNQLADALNPPSGKFLINVGVVEGITAATARTADDWIKCGNLFWHPDDPALPTLSWDGYPAQNLPAWLVTGGWVGETGSAIFPLEGWHYSWRGQTRYVYSKNLYAMGRCIGVLPDTVISAAIRRETVDAGAGTTKQVNRVVVITWRASDQFGTDDGIAYLWKFRVWCADFDVTPNVPLHVKDLPKDAYDKDTNPTGWRECGEFVIAPADGDLAPTGLPDETIWQAWRFNGDGTRAVAAVGLPTYSPDLQGSRRALEVRFTAVAPDTLGYSVAEAIATPSNGYILAADYDADGGFAWVWNRIFGNADDTTPDGNVDGVTYRYLWSGGGDGEVAAWSGFGYVVPDRWILDARTGAMAFTDHWATCSTDGALMALWYQVRLTYHGNRVVTDVHPDTAGVPEQQWASSSYLDRLNASFARDRDGHYVMGYDLGVSEADSLVYVSWPVCGESTPATQPATDSSYLGSAWLFDGKAMDFDGLPDAPMRAFPIGVV